MPSPFKYSRQESYWGENLSFAFISDGLDTEKAMATHFSILAWRIPWAEEPGGLQSIGLQRVGHN